MKKMLLVVALVALMVPAVFARDYLTGSGSFPSTGSAMWNQDSNSPGNSTQSTQPDRERDDSKYEIKAENYNWPASYDFVDAAIIPVKMEIGYWIKIDVKDKTIKLKQMEIHKYAGSVDVGVISNTAIEIKARFDKIAGMPGNLKQDALYLGVVAGNPPQNNTTFSDTIKINAGTATIRVSLRLWIDGDFAFDSSLVGQCKQVGNITLSVRPQAKPSLSGAC
jgi:hypothetical protein